MTNGEKNIILTLVHLLVLQEAGWAPGPVWTGGKSRPHRDSIPDRLARSSVAMLTELPGPLLKLIQTYNFHNTYIILFLSLLIFYVTYIK